MPQHCEGAGKHVLPVRLHVAAAIVVEALPGLQADRALAHEALDDCGRCVALAADGLGEVVEGMIASARLEAQMRANADCFASSVSVTPSKITSASASLPSHSAAGMSRIRPSRRGTASTGSAPSSASIARLETISSCACA